MSGSPDLTMPPTEKIYYARIAWLRNHQSERAGTLQARKLPVRAPVVSQNANFLRLIAEMTHKMRLNLGHASG